MSLYWFLLISKRLGSVRTHLHWSKWVLFGHIIHKMMKDFNFNVVNKKKKVIDYFVRPHSKCTSLVIYLPPPNFAFCNDVSREIEDSADAKFLGANKVHYGARANGAFCCPPPPPSPTFVYVIVFKFSWDRTHVVFGWKNGVPRGIGKQRKDLFVSCVIGHLPDDVISLLRPESFRTLLSCAN